MNKPLSSSFFSHFLITKKFSTNNQSKPTSTNVDEFTKYLDSIRTDLNETMKTSDPSDRNQFSNIIFNWAKTITQDSMFDFDQQDQYDSNTTKENTKEEYDDTDDIESTAV